MKYLSDFFAFLCVTCAVKHSSGARILAIFPLHGYSHFLLPQTIMETLTERGHRIDVVSHFPSKSSHPNYTDIIDLTGTAPIMHNNMSVDFIQEHINAFTQKPLIEVTGNKICEIMGHQDMQKLIKNPPKDPPYDLVIVGVFIANCFIAFGRHLNAPVIGIATTMLMPHYNEILGNPLNTAYVKDIPGVSMQKMDFGQRFKNTIKTTAFAHQMEYFSQRQTEIVRKYFGPHMPDISEIRRDLALLLVNSHYTLHGIRPLTPAIVEVGGLHIRDDGKLLPTDVQKWLDDSKNGFVYMSFGSMVKIESFPKETLLGLYAAFAKLKPLRFLVKVVRPEELPSGLPDNVKTLSWVPQVQVLKHGNIKVYVSHGGLNGFMEAVTFGVPIIGVPLFGDQPLNVDNFVEKRVAVSLKYEELNGEEFIRAVNTITGNASYQTNMKSLSKKFLHRPLPPLETAIFWIEYILEHGADALRSPATRLAWWQLALLDVYGTILLAVLITLYIIKLLLSALIRRIMYKSIPVVQSKKRD